MSRWTFLVIAVVLLGAGLAWWLVSPLFIHVTADEPAPISAPAKSPQVPAAGLSGSFQARAHEVSGSAMVLGTGDKRTLRFEGFSTVNGPDLRVYLATDEDATDVVDLGDLKATQGNINYDIPAGTDLDRYDKVLIWCRAFSVLFGEADLH